MRSVLACLFAMVVATACSSQPLDEQASSTSQSLASTLLDEGDIDPVEQEPSAAWTRAPNVFGGFDTRLVVAFDDENPTAPGRLGKAVSADGVTFSKCNLESACNGLIDKTRIGSVGTFLRHHSLVADGRGGVVYLTLADTDGDPSNAETVVAVLSTDGGTSFTTAFPVDSDNDECASGEQDMPDAAFDYSTNPPTLWVVWRNNSSGGSFGGCIRRFFIDRTGTPLLTSLDSAHTIVGMDRDGQIGGSQGGLKVQAGDGVVTVVYANSDEDNNCPTVEHHGVGWGSVSTFDNGVDWVDHARIFHTDDWMSCLDNAATHRIQNTIRSFDFVRTPTGIEYVVIADTETTVRLFMNAAGGAKGWISPLQTANPWFEWCPNTHTTLGDPSSPTRNWIRFEDGPCSRAFFPFFPTNLHVTLPTITADGNGRTALGFYAFRPGGKPTTDFTYVVAVNANPLLPGSPFDFTTPPDVIDTVAPAPISVPQKTVTQPFGAYLDMIAKEPSLGGTLATPGCTDDGDFFPVVVRAAANGTAQIATRGIHPL